jgi:hypothetical protein
VVQAPEALVLVHGLDEQVLRQVFNGVAVGQLVAQIAQELTLVRLPGGRDAGEGAFRAGGDACRVHPVARAIAEQQHGGRNAGEQPVAWLSVRPVRRAAAA